MGGLPDHRTPEGRSPDGPLSLEGRIRRPAARGAVRGGLQLKWLLRMIAKKGVPFLRAIFLRLAKGTIPRRFWLRLAARRPVERLNDSLGVRKLWLLAA